MFEILFAWETEQWNLFIIKTHFIRVFSFFFPVYENVFISFFFLSHTSSDINQRNSIEWLLISKWCAVQITETRNDNKCYFIWFSFLFFFFCFPSSRLINSSYFRNGCPRAKFVSLHEMFLSLLNSIIATVCMLSN